MSGLPGFVPLAVLLLAAVLMLVLPPLFGRGADAAASGSAESSPAAHALTVLREQLAALEADYAAGSFGTAAYAEARDELERRALEEGEDNDNESLPPVEKEMGWVFALTLGVPLLTLTAYLLVGAPMALDPSALIAQGQASVRMAARTAELAVHLVGAPEDAAGWEELAILRVEQDDAAGAAEAFARLSALRPEDADALVDWAFAVAMRDQSFEGEAETLLRRALALDPEHPGAQAMMRHREQRRAREAEK
ncbi:MAG: c-type cytochrome biogenesis protein CcmI [Azoarcus sp.]|jgi:cytochrome c-type biogenesis protein CcmH|nr:c-type cytochrome biogenesis protein CcmI [Azoarcus sp.]